MTCTGCSAGCGRVQSGAVPGAFTAPSALQKFIFSTISSSSTGRHHSNGVFFSTIGRTWVISAIRCGVDDITNRAHIDRGEEMILMSGEC